MVLEVGHQLAAVGVAAVGIAEGVQVHRDVLGQPELGEDLPAAGDNIHVGGRLFRADQLYPDLGELAVASGLRAFVAELRAGVEIPPGQVVGQAVGNDGADDTGRVLRPEDDVIAALGVEIEHFLGHHIGGFAERPVEDLDLLEHRRVDAVIAIAARNSGGHVHHVVLGPTLFAVEIAGAFDRLQLCHRSNLS